ncbi:hypothetical protein M8J75_002559 [Diaphorina citri]|nr:hypothetical protein M8J75_002559 [Diaphorina citri]
MEHSNTQTCVKPERICTRRKHKEKSIYIDNSCAIHKTGENRPESLTKYDLPKKEEKKRKKKEEEEEKKKKKKKEEKKKKKIQVTQKRQGALWIP